MEGQAFKLHSPFDPAGDQPEAIERLTDGLLAGEKHQTLLGVTGSGKTFTVANVIRNLNRPTLIISHNKTLAAQLYGEFQGYFPENAVEYFVSYYDYYQPEAYKAATDTYIEKESSVNESIDRMRHSATRALLERDDVIIIASVSCIYGIGAVETYGAMTQDLIVGNEFAVNFSPEDLSPIDTDLLVWLPEEGDRQPILDLPARKFLNVAQEGGEIFLDEELVGAFSHASLLSIPYAVERLVPLIETALDGDPATTADAN